MHAFTQRTSRRIPTGIGFWLTALALFTLMIAASAPSPLYVVYQAEWGFSTPMLTVIFAAYVVALLAALLTVGRLSDYVGRRPILLTSLAIEIVGMVAFLNAHGVGMLLTARLIQGFATGMATGTISATLVDLMPPGKARLGALINSVAPLSGLGAGALISGVLVQYAPSPTTLVFAGLAVAFALLAGAIVWLPETIERRPGALRSLRPRLAVPTAARGQFVVTAPILMATWAVGGLYLSLGASLMAGVLGVHSHVVAGLAVSALAGGGAIAGIWASANQPARVMTTGAFLLMGGVAVTLVGLLDASAPAAGETSNGVAVAIFFVGTIIAGLGFGAGFQGSYRSLVALAEPDERAGLFGAIYTVSYLGFSVLAVIAGLLAPRLGLLDTAVGYGLLVIVLTLGAVVPRILRSTMGGPAVETSNAAALVEELELSRR